MAIDEKILDAIDVISKAQVKNAKYDKTILAQIISCENEDTGRYKCLYQGVSIIAHASHPIMKFNNGDNVYILIVSDDTAGNGKVIIGKRY